jgi:hypothetical protein
MTEASTNARDLEELLEAVRSVSGSLDGDEMGRELAVRDVESAARRRAATAEATLGFAAGPTDAPNGPDDLLESALADLDVGALLLSAGAAMDEVPTAGPSGSAAVGPGGARRLLDETIERVDVDTRTAALRRGRDGLSGSAPLDSFGGAEAARQPGDLRGAFEAALEAIVDGTLDVFREGWKQVKSLGPDQLVTGVEAAGDLLASVPQVGRLVRLGLQAVRRGLDALLRLLPQAAQEWAGRAVAALVSAASDGLPRSAVATLLDADDVQAQISNGRWEHLPADAGARAQAALDALVTGFASISRTLTRLLRALAAAGALAGAFVLFAPVAGWLGLASSIGCSLAAGAVVVIARDHLDTEDLVGKVRGMRSILTEVGVA